MESIMSRMSDLHLTLSCAIQDGEYTFAELAEMYNVPFEWVNNLAIELAADGVEDRLDDFDESMDGDFDSAMASAGYGTDEDYGYYGDGDAG
jgi:hypothetical protein